MRRVQIAALLEMEQIAERDAEEQRALLDEAVAVQRYIRKHLKVNQSPPADDGKTKRTHSVMLRVRVTEENDKLIREAAEHAAKRRGTGTLSDWLREAIVSAARAELDLP